MNCKACGAEMADGSVFCPKCGERIEGDDAPSAPDAPESKPAPAADPGKERFSEAVRERTGVDDEEEQDLWEGGYSPKAMVGSWILGGLATIVAGIGCFMALAAFPIAFTTFAILAALIWGYLGLVFAYRRLSIHYWLTSQRFIHKAGILKQVTDRIEVIDMDDVTFEQGIIQRMLGVGSIKITSSDRSHPDLVLRGIDDVQRVATLIDDNRRAERRRRGLHIEAI